MFNLHIRKIFKVIALTLLIFPVTTKNAQAQNIPCQTSEINTLLIRLENLSDSQVDQLSNCGRPVVNYLLPKLNRNENQTTRLKAIKILGNMGTVAKDAVNPLMNILLDNQDQDFLIHEHAAYALGYIRPRDEETINNLITAFKSQNNINIRSAIAYALGENTTNNQDVIKLLVASLNSQDDNQIRATAAYSLEQIARNSKESREVVKTLAGETLIRIVQDSKQDSRVVWNSITALDIIDDTSEQAINSLIKAFSQTNNQSRESASEALADSVNLNYKQANTLKTINQALEISQKVKLALDDAKKDSNLQIQKSIDSVANTLQELEDKRQRLLIAFLFKGISEYKSILIIHPLFWMLLIFFYPKSRRIQAFFFWNKYVRDILGFWYVGFLLTWVPFLRRRLFAPFRESLLADAKIDSFDPQAYFAESKVKVKIKDVEHIDPINKSLSEIKGQIILEGESGLGKTMLIRHLVINSQQIVVYLPAQQCEKGVIEAIQDKLLGEAQDTKFLESLIYSGNLDVCIDGLNEVKQEIRQNIIAFVKKYFKANIIIATQPLMWKTPANAKTYILQPLERDQIEKFLYLRQHKLPQNVLVKGEDYEKACKQYLNDALNDQQSPKDLAAAKRILSNPMDLTVVAQMIANGIEPNLFRLEDQQYQIMAADYERSWNEPFPLKEFSEAIYQIHLKGKTAIYSATIDNFDSLQRPLECMANEQYRMVVSRQWNEKEEAKQEWTFRHDKIREFFVVQTFLGEGKEVIERRKIHLGEPHFRGVYLLLALSLPLDAAKKLGEDLFHYAADNDDYTLCNAYIKLFKTRED